MPRLVLRPTLSQMDFYAELRDYNPTIVLYQDGKEVKRLPAVCTHYYEYEPDSRFPWFMGYTKDDRYTIECKAADLSTDTYAFNKIALERSEYAVGATKATLVAVFKDVVGSKTSSDTITITVIIDINPPTG